ncbi:uncharacterized protein TEOVI_000701700 [Trypanosoma equiperdum]|uniref:T. brucei spp.-specific protein n=2 Tax=Trypanozoon TaxID=39700 RepID=Q57Z83_TRYB2|nr:hypothetical protein Tb927.5.3100 [Trypanosoma brucei brucei TREU927]AAX79550.1 hypothetical protein Tb927.5.3100 [Trypanosoma brucei]AAZ11423.1 hypothetical protein Tb927.5.3100 [Trypanosoma brucei brucei TREU927]SCU65095.1 hypothetical protein, conserved [Trypanosoma equiperdum]
MINKENSGRVHYSTDSSVGSKQGITHGGIGKSGRGYNINFAIAWLDETMKLDDPKLYTNHSTVEDEQGRMWSLETETTYPQFITLLQEYYWPMVGRNVGADEVRRKIIDDLREALDSRDTTIKDLEAGSQLFRLIFGYFNDWIRELGFSAGQLKKRLHLTEKMIYVGKLLYSALVYMWNVGKRQKNSCDGILRRLEELSRERSGVNMLPPANPENSFPPPSVNGHPQTLPRALRNDELQAFATTVTPDFEIRGE